MAAAVGMAEAVVAVMAAAARATTNRAEAVFG
jgi:hypothetical protein